MVGVTARKEPPHIPRRKILEEPTLAKRTALLQLKGIDWRAEAFWAL